MTTRLFLASFAMLVLCCGLTGCSWLRQATMQHSRESERLIEQARAAEQRGETELAESFLRQALVAEPDAIETLWQLSELLVRSRQPGRADAVLQKLTQVAPEDPRAWVELARLRHDQGRHAAAEGLLETALELDPEMTVALLLKAQLDEERMRFELAMDTYHRVLRVEPQNSEAMLRIAAIHMKMSKPERAAPMFRAVCQSSLATVQQKAEAHWALGLAYGQEQRWADASLALASGIEGRPTLTADDWYRLAYARYRSRDEAGLRTALEKSLQLDSTHAASLRLRTVLQHDDQRLASTEILPVGHTVGAESGLPVPPGW